MADPVQCKTASGSVIDIAQETLVLAFDLGGSTAKKSPETIKKILESKELKKVIDETLRTETTRLLEEQNKRILTAEDAKATVKKVGEKALDQAKDQFLEAIKKSSDYKQLEQKLQELQCAYKQSPVGVWIEEKGGKYVLYVVAIGVAVGGAGAMYATWQGDDLAKPLTKLAEHLVKFKPMGNVEISAGEIKFVPSTRTVGVELKVTAKWERVNVEWKMGVTMENGKLTGAGGSGKAEVDLGKGFKFTGITGWNYQLAKPDALNPGGYHTWSAGAVLSYKGTGSLQWLSVDLTGKVGQSALKPLPEFGSKEPGGTGPVDASVMLGVTATFDFLGGGGKKK